MALNPPGNTETHALLGGSPAIDAIPPLSCAVTTDQRGVARPYGDGCDIGAYEYEPPAPVGGASVPVAGCDVFALPLAVAALTVVAAAASIVAPTRCKRQN